MKLAIIGSTGSIGTQALDIIGTDVEVTALACGSNYQSLLEQYYQFRPEYLHIGDSAAYQQLKTKLVDEDVELSSGDAALVELAECADYDVLLTAIVGAKGLLPTIAAIKRGKRIALANKETLVIYGREIMALAKKYKAEIIPVDSEHSAIFQSLQGSHYSEIEKIILTASGGTFFGKKASELMNVKASEALKHPKWNMGRKISIDSATLMNKGLEVIEARWLFDTLPENIEVLVHREAIIHSMVEFQDSAVIAQLGLPDMKVPINYALYYPQRKATNLPKLNLAEIAKLSFYLPDLKTFPCLELAYEVLKIGGSAPCVLNAANEELVALYLDDKIGLYDIPKGIEKALSAFDVVSDYSLDDILKLDKETRTFIQKTYK